MGTRWLVQGHCRYRYGRVAGRHRATARGRMGLAHSASQGLDGFRHSRTTYRFFFAKSNFVYSGTVVSPVGYVRLQKIAGCADAVPTT